MSEVPLAAAPHSVADIGVWGAGGMMQGLGLGDEGLGVGVFDRRVGVEGSGFRV